MKLGAVWQPIRRDERWGRTCLRRSRRVQRRSDLSRAGISPSASAILLALGAIVALICTAFIGQSAGKRSVPATQGVELSVDFGRRVHTNGSMLGFLHGMDETTPGARWIAPLHPALWRGNFHSAPYDRASRFGATYVLVVSDLWGYPNKRFGRKWRKPPWEALSSWYAFVRKLALANRHRRLVWDIWNEPDSPGFWNGTADQYYQTFAVADAAIRSVLGSRARVSGPSISKFNWSWLRGLLMYCRARRCRVDVLSWHELEPAGISSIAEHLELARSRLLDSRAFSSTLVRLIHVNEYVAASDALYPGELTAYLHELERGNADGAAMACWPDPSGGWACHQHTLDGLVDPQSGRPRAVWWTAKAYAEGASSRVQATSNAPGLALLAASHAPNNRAAEVLVGHFDTHTGLLPTVAARLSLRRLRALAFLRRAQAVRVSIEYLAPSTGPYTPRRTAETVPISHGSAMFVLPPLGIHDAFVIRLSVPSYPGR